MNIATWVKRWKELHPEKTAAVFEGRQITYSALHGSANQIGCWLQSLGIEKGDRVAVMLTNCPQFIELYLACARLGAIFVPINTRLAIPELEHILHNCRPRLMVYGGSQTNRSIIKLIQAFWPPMLLAEVGHDANNRKTLNYLDEIENYVGKKPFLTKSSGPADPEEPQVIMYTSGTTGQPKGAVLSYRKTFFNCLNADIFFKLQFDDVMLIILPMFHSGGLFIQASPILYKGGTMIIHSKFDPAATYQDIEQFKVTKFLGVPTLYRSLLAVDPQKRKDLSSLKVCAIGGEKTTPELLLACREAGFSLRQIMGQTETSILLWASEGASLRKPGTVGRPVFHAEVNIVDHHGSAVGPGEVGEIVVRGSIMMKEYWQDPVKTEEIIKDGWLHTGDLAKMDEDGYFYLVDRVDDMYISGGENVYPAEIERVLKKHPDIEDAAVVGMPHEKWGQVGQAFVIPKPGANLTAETVVAFCKGRLTKYKWPAKVVFCGEFTRTALGKVRKNLIHS
jgi:fatty-acyl-CoA synthase